MLAALGVLLIVGGAATAGLLAIRADSRAPVLVATREIEAGQLITEDALSTTPVASESTSLVPASQESALIGQYARVTISDGQLIDTSMIMATGALQPGLAAVGASLASGRVPASGLEPGDVVDLVEVSDSEGVVLADGVLVSSFVPVQAGTGGTSATATFIVSRADAARIAGVNAAGELAVVLVERGAAQGD